MLELLALDAGSTSWVSGLVADCVVGATVTIGYTFLVSVRASRHQRCSQALRPVGFSNPAEDSGDMGATR